MNDEFKEKIKALRRAVVVVFPHTIPVLTGFLVLGMAYGVLMNSKGYNVYWSVFASAVCFCGSMQFVAITFLTTVFDPIGAFLLSIMVNARHLFYGIAMLDKYKNLGKIRPFLILTLCDETFSIVSTIKKPDNISDKHFYFTLSFLNYIYWVLGALLGGIVGDLVSFNTKGLDFALTALFVVLFMELMKIKSNRVAGIIGVAGSFIGLLIFGADNMVIPSMIIILTVMLLGKNKIKV